MAATRQLSPRFLTLIPRDLRRVFAIVAASVLLLILLAWLGVIRSIHRDFLSSRVEALNRTGCVEDTTRTVYSKFPLTRGRQMRVFVCPKGLIEQVPKFDD